MYNFKSQSSYCTHCQSAQQTVESFILYFNNFKTLFSKLDVNFNTYHNNIQINKLKQSSNSKSNKCSMKSINFHHFNTSTMDKGSNTKLCGYYQNVRGLRTKINVIKCSVSSFFYDYIILSETWLNEEFNDNELGFSQYNIFRCDRNINTSNLSRGGGVLCAYCLKQKS